MGLKRAFWYRWLYLDTNVYKYNKICVSSDLSIKDMCKILRISPDCIRLSTKKLGFYDLQGL